MDQMKGKIISISGLDGAGKSTQLKLLHQKFTEQGISCGYFQFGPEHYGVQARSKLEELSSNQILFTRLCIDWKGLFPLIHDFVYDEELQTRENAIAVTSVFAGGCVQVFHQCLQPLLQRGVHLIVDRYWFDDIVYRSYWVEERWIRDLYASIPVPDLAIFLDTPPETSFERNQHRIDGKSPLMKRLETVQEISQKFMDLAKQENMFVVDGRQDLGLKHQMILNEVQKLLPKERGAIG